MDKQGALSLLRKALNIPGANFRDGQWEAIEKLTTFKEKLLVIQRTGWGKSSVYFISSKILRDQGKGPTIIISPLLALMRNQVETCLYFGCRYSAYYGLLLQQNFKNVSTIQLLTTS